jgi:Na+-driven multidrug efflux pump
VLWPLFAAMQPINGIVFALDGILIGASDGVYIAVSMAFSFAVCAALLAVGLAADWGIRGVWVALVALMLVRCATLLHRFRGRRWLVTGWS